MTPQLAKMWSSLIFLDVALFLLQCVLTASSFMPISSLILEWWQFSFIRDWPEIQKLEIPRLSFVEPIFKDWDKLEIPNLVRMFLIKYYWMLQNARSTAFTVSELLRENQKWGQNYPGKKAACLVGQCWKMLNFVWPYGTKTACIHYSQPGR